MALGNDLKRALFCFNLVQCKQELASIGIGVRIKRDVLMPFNPSAALAHLKLINASLKRTLGPKISLAMSVTTEFAQNSQQRLSMSST